MACVLVVDDYDDARELLELVFLDAGYAVVSAPNGSEAVAQATAHRPDVILMDIFMPVMDGVEATRRIKALPTLADVPVVAYTAKPTPIEPFRELFEDVCVKPCEPDKVLAAVAKALRGAGDGRRTPDVT